jgi:hypothetical protein
LVVYRVGILECWNVGIVGCWEGVIYQFFSIIPSFLVGIKKMVG